MKLQKKAAIFLILPTFLVLTGMGIVGFYLVRDALLDQWKETAIEKLQRSAHSVDMRLMQPKGLLQFLQDDSSIDRTKKDHDIIIEQLKALDGVAQVNHAWKAFSDKGSGSNSGRQSRDFHHSEQLSVTSPQYNPGVADETVSLAIYFKDINDDEIGNIEVLLSFDDLIKEVVETPWWKSNRAYLVDEQGVVLAFTEDAGKRGRNGLKLQERGLLEQKSFNAISSSGSGTVFEPGLIPQEIAGFYHLSEAPWTMVVFARGDQVLDPVISQGKNFIIVIAIGTLLVLLIIHRATGITTQAIKKVSVASKNLALGKFGEPLTSKSRDEVGELTHNFNSMTQQLRERLRLKEGIVIASEVQQNFLPRGGFRAEGVEIDGLILYCDETGGDYFDLLSFPKNPGKVGVVVGDVVGHGIGAALLMASVRALLRSCSSHHENPASVIRSVNEIICQDTIKTGSFVTLYYLVVDWISKQVEWVRCGHDPAVLFSPETGQFKELRGEGLIIGLDNTFDYQKNSLEFGDARQIILIASDGAWEVENPEGEKFGKQRLNQLIADNHELPSKQILDLIAETIGRFRGGSAQKDDITITVVKLNYT
jgi:sigma-B regulation protein RsbU (phosphoserine phosphatase)